MGYITNTLGSLLQQTAFLNPTGDDLLTTGVACVFLYLATRKGFEPLLLVPIALGMLLVNIYPQTMATPEDTLTGVGGLPHYFYVLDEWSILPSLIFMGADATTDFGPLIANSKSFLLGAVAQFGIYSAYFMAIFMRFSERVAAAISIIGGANGSTPIFLASKPGQTGLIGLVAVVAHSYMTLIPIIQLPIMKLLAAEKERRIKMEQLRPVFKLEKILFPTVVTIVVCIILPSMTPFVDMLMLGNPFREFGVVNRLFETASSVMMYIVVILLGASAGVTISAETFLDLDTVKIILLGLITFVVGMTAGVLSSKLMYKVAGSGVNPLTGPVGVPAVPMATHVSQKVGSEADPTNFLLIHAMRPSVAGIISTAVAAGTFTAIFGVK